MPQAFPSNDPYRMDEETIVSFSGGRTSGYLLFRILAAHSGRLPPHVHVCFSNTGKERVETLDFVEECSRRWDVPIVWLEYTTREPEKLRICNHATASRTGQPFEELIDAKRYLPNPVTRFCTTELKIRTVKRYAMKHLGWDYWQNAIGLRADEPYRVAKIRNQRERWETIAPLAKAGVTKQDVTAFWQAQPFDLRLPNTNGKTPHGNCDLCYLKGADLIAGLIRETPEAADWWIAQEQKFPGVSKTYASAHFRSDRPSYRKIRDAVSRQLDAFEGTDHLAECHCHD